MFQRRGIRGKERTEGCDEGLRPFLDASEEHAAAAALDQLFAATIQPQVQRCLSLLTHDPDEREALRGMVCERLLLRLQQLRADPGASPIADLEAYVAVVVRHAYDHHLQQRFPQRHRLKMRLCYRLRHTPEMALWERDGVLLAGLASWQTKPRRVVRIEADTDQWARRLETPSRGTEESLCRQLLERAGGPVPFEEVVAVLAGALGVTDTPESPAPPEERLPDPRAVDPADQAAQAEYLAALWGEILQLPSRQAAALLLNLRDHEGHGVIDLIRIQGIAREEEIGQVVGWDEAKRQSLWPELPLDDNRLADLLGVTRQQVINLRKVARERLARRLQRAGFSW